MNINTAYLKHGNKNNAPNIIVIHSMGEFIKTPTGTYHAVSFLNRSGLSAHSLVDKDGTDFRCRKDTQGAYHAKGFNTNSLGLEVLVKGDHDYGSFLEAIKKPYMTEEQYKVVKEQVYDWLDAWPIQKIVRHSDLSPERKVDPGEGFPWQDFLNEIGEL